MQPPVFFPSHPITTQDVWRLVFYASGVLLILLVVVFWWVRITALEDHIATTQQQRQLYAAHIAGVLSKYEAIPALLATNQRVLKVLQQPHNFSARQALNEYFTRSALASQALDIYLMNQHGVTVAASNWEAQPTFIGKNFSYRPYFQQAMQGQTGRYFALGTTSGVRGYYFADPVYQLGQIIGAVVVKLDVSLLEKRWGGVTEEIVLTDPQGIVFITTNPTWLYRSLTPLEPAILEQIHTAKRYPQQTLEPLSWAIQHTLQTGEWVRVGNQAQVQDYLHLEYPMPEVGWLLHVLNPLDTVNERVLNALLITATIFGILLLGVAMVWQRQQYHARARAVLQKAHSQLEERVQARTADLRHQIEERHRAEEALHAAQDKLVQTAKLAMLGQLSASVNHELNQPLTAMRSYAGNAQRLLQQQRTAEVAHNLAEITQLVDRMARISAQLKQFARKSSGECVAVSLTIAVDVSLQLWRRELRHAGITVQVAPEMQHVQIFADATRLEQVFVNLIGNALQALVAAQTPDPSIQLLIQHAVPMSTITVRDNGPGIPEEQLAQIFDPFFTTRQAGLGLGLAISQQIIESFGGTLTAAQAPTGGAAFSFTLRCV